ncbi:hypothetical protein M3221_17300 [Domibacillus indicus]|nr:hypothetical protein [Domibacillus indicus]MCM3790145.1 hypothetical protein [Domibacillus indicus]
MMKSSIILVYHKVSPTAEYNHTENAPEAVLNKICAWKKSESIKDPLP